MNNDISNRNHLLNSLEAMLIASGTPLQVEKAAEILDIGVKEAESLVKELAERCKKPDRGYEIALLDGSCQICTKIGYKTYVEKVLEIKKTSSLSKPATETLAAIAYKQPVTKAYIEKLRGVDCSSIINTLLERELIEEKGRLDAPGRPILYGTTMSFLKCFGLSSLSELPDIKDIK